MKCLLLQFVFIIYILEVTPWKWEEVKPTINYYKPEGIIEKRANIFGNRITGGEEIINNSAPYLVALFITRSDGIYFCGGSLITENYVLTAAHCVDGASEIEVILGAHNVRNNEETQQRINTSNYIIHEQFEQTIDFDIALIKLTTQAKLNEYVKTIKLPSWRDISNDFVDVPSRQTGWGKTSDYSPGISDVPHTIVTKTMSNDECNDYFFGSITEHHICTNTTGGKSVCNGDSGSPLVNEEKETQMGIAAFVIIFGCEVYWPAGFIRVTPFLVWIEKNSDVNIDCQ